MRNFLVLAALAACFAVPARAQLTPSLTPETKVVEVKRLVKALGLSEGVVMIPTGHYSILTFDLEGNRLGELPCEHVPGTPYPMFDKSGVTPIVRNDTGAGEVCLVDRTGKIIKSYPEFEKYPSVWCGFVDGVAAVGNKWTSVKFIDKNGAFVNKDAEQNIQSLLEIAYNDPHFDPIVYPLNEGRRLFYDYYANSYGFLDASGKIVIGVAYGEADSFSDGVALVKVGRNWGYIDKNGKEVIRARYGIRPESFHEGKAIIYKRDGRAYYINKQDEVVSPAFLKAWRFFGGYAIVITEDNPGALTVIDKDFKPVSLFTDVAEDVIYDDEEGVFYTDKAVYGPGGEIFFMIPPKEGRLLSGFDKGLASVLYNGDIGLVNKKGEITLVFREAGN